MKTVNRIVREARGEIRSRSLDGFVQMLNRGLGIEGVPMVTSGAEHPLARQAERHLVELVESWQSERTKWQDTVDSFRKKRAGPAPFPAMIGMKLPSGLSWDKIQRQLLTTIHFSGIGAQWHVVYNPRPPWFAWSFAVNSFLNFATNMDLEKLGGPCARCGRYFVRKRASQKVYCTRNCGNRATAVARTREKWDKNRNARLELAKRALAAWSRADSAEPFPKWASRKYPELTARFLSRAINNEDLPEPRKET